MGYHTHPIIFRTNQADSDMHTPEAKAKRERTGVLEAIGSFLIWGFSPLYYRAVGEAGSLEILSHRVIWSLLFCLILIAFSGQTRALLHLFSQARTLLTLFVSALLVSVNWLGFIWAVNNDRALEASMGYFIFPIVMVVLGGIFLNERLNRNQMLALALVVLGVLNLLLGQQQLPWIALLLASSMGLYSLVRKQVPAGPLVGLTMECLLLLPVAALYLLYLERQGELLFGSGAAWMDILLICSALMTALPLILYTSAARKLRLGTLGLLQYLNPTCQFLLAVFLFAEPFSQTHLYTFVLIWSGLALFSIDSQRRLQRDSPA